jgi:putative sugar O-methyltransferase
MSRAIEVNAGPHWGKILRTIQANPPSLENFRRDPALWHIDNSNPTRRGANDVELRTHLAYEAVVPLLSETTKPLIVESERGNPYVYLINEKQVSYASIEYAYMAEILYQNVDRPKIIVEIGAGFGGLAKMLLALWADVEYYIIDFPEILRIQQYYLADVDENVYYLEPPDIHLNFTDTDLWINSRSMMEMVNEEQAKYVEVIRDTGGKFFSLNSLHRTPALELLDGRTRILDRPWLLQHNIREVLFEG